MSSPRSHGTPAWQSWVLLSLSTLPLSPPPRPPPNSGPRLTSEVGRVLTLYSSKGKPR